MLFSKLSRAFLGASILILSIQAIAKNIINISISATDGKHIKLEYNLPSNCKYTRLGNPYQERTAGIRRKWVPLDSCGKITENGFLVMQRNCDVASFSVPIEATVMDRAYPTAYPFDEEGVFIHTGIFSISDECGEQRWSFNTPNGAIIIDGINRGVKTSVNQYQYPLIQYTGVFLSYKEREKQSSVIANKISPPWLIMSAKSSSEEISRYYNTTYPSLIFASPTLFISNIINDGPSMIQADVSAPRMIRFSYFNARENFDPDFIKSQKKNIAHEFAHILQSQIELPPYVREGGAEFIRWMAEYKLGWTESNDLADEFDESLRSCLAIAGGKTWKDIEMKNLQLGREIYSCGLVLHIIGLASRKNSESAEENMHIYYQNLRSKSKVEFSRALECGNNMDCNSTWIFEVFNSNRSFRELTRKQLKRLKITNLHHQTTKPNSRIYKIDIHRLITLLEKKR